jgi:phosphocarrier protein HPr
MATEERTITVASSSGLHARPAALFVEAVGKSGHKVTITKGDKKPANGASILSVLSLGIEKGDAIVLTVDGDDATAVADTLEAFLLEDHDA